MTSYHTSPNRKGTGTRDKHDRYETPDYVTEDLLEHVSLSQSVLEPSCGTGKVARVMKRHGLRVTAVDLEETGHDFLKRKRIWKGDMVTNPPYHIVGDFVENALKVTDGKVCLLLRHGFLWSDGRKELFETNPPSLVLIMPNRIRFIQRDGTPISGQGHDHLWVVWPERKLRGPHVKTETRWATEAGRADYVAWCRQFERKPKETPNE